MNFFDSETARFSCDNCRRLTWHKRSQLTSNGKFLLTVLAPFTLGLSLVYFAYRVSYEDQIWKCSLCAEGAGDLESSTYTFGRGDQKQSSREQSEPSSNEASSTLYSFSREQLAGHENSNSGKRPMSKGYDSTQSKERFSANDFDSIPEYGKFQPTSSSAFRGTDSNRAAFLNKPQPGCSDEEYWAWHDTLYLGGSWRSPEWQQRAREAKQRDGRRCVICKSDDGLQTDHIVPLSQGGSNDFENLQTLCHACHEQKTGRQLRRFS